MDRVNAVNLAMIRKAAQMTQVGVARKRGRRHRRNVHGHRIKLDLGGLAAGKLGARERQALELESARPAARCAVVSDTEFEAGLGDLMRLIVRLGPAK
jgi:hypothetical protein